MGAAASAFVCSVIRRSPRECSRRKHDVVPCSPKPIKNPGRQQKGTPAAAHVAVLNDTPSKCLPHAFQVFNNLATEKDLRQLMLDQGAAPAIIALAAASNNRHLRSECVEALCKLAVQPGSEAHIIAEVDETCTGERGVNNVPPMIRQIRGVSPKYTAKWPTTDSR